MSRAAIITECGLLAILICALCYVSLQAQQKNIPLPVEEVIGALRFPYYSPVDLSPDGIWVAYTLQDDRRREKPKDGYSNVFSSTGVSQIILGCDIHITNTRTGESKNLTEGRGSNFSPVWSPDGKYLAFYSDLSGAAGLWVWEKASGQLRQISKEIVRPSYPSETAQWSSDSRKILVKILPEGATLESARHAIDSPQIIESQSMSSSTALIYRSSRKEGEVEAEKQYGRNIWTSIRRTDLAIIELDSGKVQRIATGYNPAWFAFSPDCSKIAFTSINGAESSQSQQLLYDLIIVSITIARPQVVAANIQLDYAGMTVSWSPDGKMLSYITSSSGAKVKGDCFVVPVSGEGARNVTPLPHPYFSNTWRAPLWDATGEHIYLLGASSIWKAFVKSGATKEVAKIPHRRIIEAVAPRGGGRFWSPDGGRSMILATRDDQTKQQGFYQIDLITGGATKLLEEKISYGDIPIYNIDVSNDGERFVFIAEDAAHSAEMWIASTDFKTHRQITRTNPNLDRYRMGSSRLIEWRGLDGDVMRGALLLPPDYLDGKRYPLIVRIYPGDNLSDNINSFGLAPYGAGVDNKQLFATRGYVILLADSSRPKGNPMRGIANSVLPGISKLIEIGIADPERIGLIGHSNGGYGVLSLLVQTSLFRTAICSGGLGNIVGHYGFMKRDGSSSWSAYQEETLGMKGPPWQYPNKYIENSPFFYLDKVQTPLLLIHGAEDNVVPAFLADEIFVGLKRLGKEVEYAKYEGEGHWEGAWGYINQVDYLHRIIDWFDKYLKNDRLQPSVADHGGQR